ncbi:MAG: hypothetical protein ACI4MY_00330 [Christensenellales bacterium]
MKKLLTILLLSVCLLSLATAGVCVAEVAPYYVVKTGDITLANSLALYADLGGSPADFVACYIPPTYYFQSTGTVKGDYTLVTYNNAELWAKTTDIPSKTSVAPTDKPIEGNNAYYSKDIAIDPQIIADEGTIKVFYDATLTDDSTGRKRILAEDVTGGIKFVGLNEIGGKIYYYVTVVTSSESYTGFIDPACTDTTDLTFASIPQHPNSIVVPDDVPTVDNPTIEEPASNNLVRNVLIGVICVLCVIIVFLIFKPTRKAG